MGLKGKGPPLPAPTETDSTVGNTDSGSRMTDRSTYDLPEDGSPITIATRRTQQDELGLTKDNKSQTSLLIEYFEASKEGQGRSKRRPSVRVKVTPSKSRSRSGNDHIQITERKGTRKASYTKRIHLSPHKGSKSPRPDADNDDGSVSSFRSATEESNVSRRPVEVEIMRHGSPLIPSESSAKYVQHNMSDISSMPADSFLDGRSPERKRSRSLSRGEALVAGAATGLAAGAVVDKLRTPSRRRSRSLSRERIVAQKVVEKVRGDKSERRRKHSDRSRSISGEHAEDTRSPRRRSSRSHHEDSMVTGTESSLLTATTGNSNISRNSDKYSIRSGASKSSINNPKLLETVEDAIRRLILPELTALKREQSKHSQRDKERRGSMTSTSNLSRDSREEMTSSRRVSSRGSRADVGQPMVTLNDGEVLSGDTIKGRKARNVERVLDSPNSYERGESEDTIVRDDKVRKKKSRGLEAAAAGAGLGALTAAALHRHQSQEEMDETAQETVKEETTKERRRRRKNHSRGGSLAEEVRYERPVMPLMSEINSSEMTRTSILSAETDRPDSAHSSDRGNRGTPLREVPRGIASPVSRAEPAAVQGLGMQHSNFSRGNLSLHSQPSGHQLHGQEYDVDEHGRKVPMRDLHSPDDEDSYAEETEDHSHAFEAGLVGAAAGAGLAAYHHNHFDEEDDDEHDDSQIHESQHPYFQNHQEVPPPLRYIPYGHERRGLSPIQSVSGYTEENFDTQNHRNSVLTRSTGSYSTLNKSKISIQSGASAGIAQTNQHDFQEVRQGGLTESELTQDGEYWEEQHRENDRIRDPTSKSYHNSDDYKRTTRYTDESNVFDNDRTAAESQYKEVGLNPGYVHNAGVESNVASLVNASELTGSGISGNTNHNARRASFASIDDDAEQRFTSRGNSPTKEDRPLSSLRNTPAKSDREFEVNQTGYRRPQGLTTADADNTAADNAASVLARARHFQSGADRVDFKDRQEHTGAPLQKSFKDRASDNDGVVYSPRHSVDALSEATSYKLTASGLPDRNSPMPEIGYGGDGVESDMTTNPSLVQSPGSGRLQWDGQTTPTRPLSLKSAEAGLIGAAIGAGAAAAIAGHSREVSRDHDDEWARTSGDRKRDTLVTNPYEGTSPIAALEGGLEPDLSGFENIHSKYQSKMGYSGSPHLKDEGYISSAPNARSVGAQTPERRRKSVDFLEKDLGASTDGGDPYYTSKHSRHLSGMSQGMESPIYDSVTGNGIDRIQSRDIVALMDHLTVRDAQRSARDTEILVTLVRSAAEMRNSFEDMKRLLIDTEDVIITEVQGNTEKTVQKAINGPRPQPQSNHSARSVRGSQDGMYEDMPTKRRNVFRRALQGLSNRSTNDIGKIEDMLVQLLGEVEGLKLAQGIQQGQSTPRSRPGESNDYLQQEGNYENDRGYEPEGNAGTSTASHASQSGHLSLPLSTRGPSARGFDGRKFSDHRISTVPEGDEEENAPSNQLQTSRQSLSPPRENARGGSAPLGTPPQQHVSPTSHSNDNTPRTDKGKKHKSSNSSGWMPKVSRWSETTASTVFRGFRSSGRNSGPSSGPSSGAKEADPQSDQFVDQYQTPPSRSGSDFGAYLQGNAYPAAESDKLHSGFSAKSVKIYDEEDPSDLHPPEDPKYKSEHRDSLILQHPQPVPGQQYQTRLESEARNFNKPMSPSSLNWGSSTSLNPHAEQQVNRYSHLSINSGGALSPVSDSGFSAGPTALAPAIPAKIPLAPQSPTSSAPNVPSKLRQGKLQKPSPLSQERSSVYDDGYEPGGSPRSAATRLNGNLGVPAGALGVPARKPTGPRSMSTSSKTGELQRDDTVIVRKNRDTFGTFGTVASHHSNESDTF